MKKMKKLNFSLILSMILLSFMVMQSCNLTKKTQKQEAINENAPIKEQKAVNNKTEADKSKVKMVRAEDYLKSLPKTTVEFKEKAFDFGTVMEGEIVEHDFTFTNTGNDPLILSKVRSSCGCTVPSWPKVPIAPGKTAVIKAKFNTKRRGRPGGAPQHKTIRVSGNFEGGQVILTLKGKVDKKTDTEK